MKIFEHEFYHDKTNGSREHSWCGTYQKWEEFNINFKKKETKKLTLIKTRILIKAKDIEEWENNLKKENHDSRRKIKKFKNKF